VRIFTGIVIEQGVVHAVAPDLAIEAPQVAGQTVPGDSVSIDGCCLTATTIDGAVMTFHAVPETLRRTTLGGLVEGHAVNLEPALRAGDRLGGHWVQGHVDGIGTLVASEPEGEAVNMTFQAPADVLRTTIEKGSIAVNGVSLTVVAVDDERFSVTVIPHTREVTNLGALTVGGRVNLEADLLGKYVEKLGFSRASGTIEAVSE
jgi:riboflavin synthase